MQVSLAAASARSVDRLAWGVIFASLLISRTILRVVEGPSLLSTGLLVAAGGAWLWGITRR